MAFDIDCARCRRISTRIRTSIANSLASLHHAHRLLRNHGHSAQRLGLKLHDGLFKASAIGRRWARTLVERQLGRIIGRLRASNSPWRISLWRLGRDRRRGGRGARSSPSKAAQGRGAQSCREHGGRWSTLVRVARSLPARVRVLVLGPQPAFLRLCSLHPTSLCDKSLFARHMFKIDIASGKYRKLNHPVRWLRPGLLLRLDPAMRFIYMCPILCLR